MKYLVPLAGWAFGISFAWGKKCWLQLRKIILIKMYRTFPFELTKSGGMHGLYSFLVSRVSN